MNIMFGLLDLVLIWVLNEWYWSVLVCRGVLYLFGKFKVLMFKIKFLIYEIKDLKLIIIRGRGIYFFIGKYIKYF